MSVQYLSDDKGRVTAVQVPIEEWEIIKIKYPEIAHVNSELPKWQRELIDDRLHALQLDPSQIKPISEIFEELDK